MTHQPMESDEMSCNEYGDIIIINPADGLPNELELQPENTKNTEVPQTLDELINDVDLPTSLIVTNIDSSVFHNDEAKKIAHLWTLTGKSDYFPTLVHQALLCKQCLGLFEQKIQILFSQYGELESIQFLRSFKRMRVNYKCPADAAKARMHLHRCKFEEKSINCYFAQPVAPVDCDDQHLRPPVLTKRFLISPPASPPCGWEPQYEAKPLVNYDLLAAIANLTPGEAHELHPQQGSQPGIVVHVCEETASGVKPRIVHTRCPQQN